MKRITFLSSIVFVLLLGISFTSCKKDKETPVITILGNNPVNTCADITYQDAGATATDNEDGDISDRIKVSSNVDTAFVGTYHVTYTVSDEAGNEGVARREVNVIFCK